MRWFAGPMIALTVLAGIAGTASAQEEDQYFRIPHRVHVFIHGGICVPAKPAEFKSYWNTALPVTIGVGVPIFSWMDVNGSFAYYAFDNNHVKTKPSLGFVGVPEVVGGAIKTMMYMGSVRFLAVPNQQTNPFAEVGVGYFQTKVDALEIEEIRFSRTMEDSKGMSIMFGAGLQYALNEHWSTYIKYFWTLNTDDSFEPGSLVRFRGTEPVPGGSQQFSSLAVGIVARM